MKHIVFRYKDEASRGEWRTQECIVDNVVECKKFYGLDDDPTIEEYEMVSVEEC